MQYKLIFIINCCLLIILAKVLTAQVSINTDGSSPDSSSILEVKSINKGLLIPRMTSSQIRDIVNPTNGLMVFSTTDKKCYIYLADIQQWKEIPYGHSTKYKPAIYTIGNGNICSNTTVSGNYISGNGLGTSNSVMINVNVQVPGSYSMSTDTINGYFLYATGAFSSTGNQIVTLFGNGAPYNPQTDHFLLQASNSNGQCYFDISVSPFSCGNLLYDQRNKKNYLTVQIGSQCWMQENLNIGFKIPGNQNQTNNSLIEKYCYDNLESNCDTYGGLYQWDEMMQYLTNTGTQGICPNGWHLPSDAEYCTLTQFLDSNVNCDITGYSGILCGTVMKSTSGWGNGNGSNQSGFNALSAGSLQYYSWNFYGIGRQCHFWTSSSDDVGSGLIRSLYYSKENIHRAYSINPMGFSVRCVKNIQ